MGINQVIVAINKIDLINWNQNQYNKIKNQLYVFLTKKIGFKKSHLFFIPVSGLKGENLSTLSDNNNLKLWYTSNITLVDLINKLKPPSKLKEKCKQRIRICITKIFQLIIIFASK